MVELNRKQMARLSLRWLLSGLWTKSTHPVPEGRQIIEELKAHGLTKEEGK